MTLKRFCMLMAVLAAISVSASAAGINLTFENIATYPWDSSSPSFSATTMAVPVVSGQQVLTTASHFQAMR